MTDVSNSPSHTRFVVTVAAIASIVAVMRYFMQGWLEPLGVPTIIGSLIASITVVLFCGLVILFRREGKRAQGRYFTAAAWFISLAAWCELLIIAGIFVTERTGATTYYQGPWEAIHEAFPTPSAHIIGHTQGFIFRTLFGLLLGAIIYLFAKRKRPTSSMAPAN